MKFDQFIMSIRSRNPELMAAGAIKIKVKNFEQLLEQAYYLGFEEAGKKFDGFKEDPKKGFEDIFGSMFGKK